MENILPELQPSWETTSLKTDGGCHLIF